MQETLDPESENRYSNKRTASWEEMKMSNRTDLKKRILTLVITAFSLPLCFGPAACAEQEEAREVSYEVKLLLDSDLVLNDDLRLTDEMCRLFNVEDSYKPIDVVYLDTPERDFLREGWINRLRQKDGKEKIERTYKKRYPVFAGDIDAALAQAAADGFGEYETQVDWGYVDMTLSVSMEDSEKHPKYASLSEYPADEAIQLLERAMPPEERSLSDLLSDTQIVGPLRFLRIKGSWQDIEEISIEIWPTLHITELSFDADDYEFTADARNRLLTFLDEGGMLLHEDALKTTLILSNRPDRAP